MAGEGGISGVWIWMKHSTEKVGSACAGSFRTVDGGELGASIDLVG